MFNEFKDAEEMISDMIFRGELALPDEECVAGVQQAGWVTTTCRGWGRERRRTLQ